MKWTAFSQELREVPAKQSGAFSWLDCIHNYPKFTFAIEVDGHEFELFSGHCSTKIEVVSEDKYNVFFNNSVNPARILDVFVDDKGMPHNLAGKGAAAMFASLFTFGLSNVDKKNHDSVWEQDLSELQWGSDGSNVVILLPNDSKFAKAGGLGETFGMPNTWYEYGIKKISRSDINSVGLGHWITTMVRSNINLCLRDINKYQISDKVIFNKERGFYPYYPLSLSSEYKL
jgi:hypothetical protein